MRTIGSFLTRASTGYLGAAALGLAAFTSPLAAARDGLPYSYSARQVRVQGYAVQHESVTVTRFHATTWTPTPYGVYPVFISRARPHCSNAGVPRARTLATPSVDAYRDWQREMWRGDRVVRQRD